MTGERRLSAVIITRNEEARLERCLASLAWAHEVVVVDSGSSDRTVDIARAHGAGVHWRPFDDFAAQRNWAVARAQHEWVLVVDADEEVSAPLRDEILALLSGDPGADAYWLPRENIVFGKRLRHGGHWPDRQLRLFRRGRGRFTGAVHERFVAEGSVGHLRRPLVHHSTATIGEHLAKLRQYTDLEARELRRQGRRAGALDLLARPLASFLRSWVLQRGFLDGYVGLLAAGLGSFYVFVKYAKLTELQSAAGSPAEPRSPAS